MMSVNSNCNGGGGGGLPAPKHCTHTLDPAMNPGVPQRPFGTSAVHRVDWASIVRGNGGLRRPHAGACGLAHWPFWRGECARRVVIAEGWRTNFAQQLIVPPGQQGGAARVAC